SFYNSLTTATCGAVILKRSGGRSAGIEWAEEPRAAFPGIQLGYTAPRIPEHAWRKCSTCARRNSAERIVRMKKQVKKRTGRTIASLTFGIVLGIAYFGKGTQAQGPANRFPAEISSQNLALTTDGQLLAVVNPDNDSVSFFDVRNDRNVKLAEVLVGI